jgi:hypothetical protein
MLDSDYPNMMIHFIGTMTTIMHLLLLAVSFCLACGVIALFIWPLWATGRAAIQQGQQMHQVPCAGCCFFTGDYTLKCTVHPKTALSISAIDCADYRPVIR